MTYSEYTTGSSGLSNSDVHDGRDTCQWCRLDPPREQADEQSQ